MYGDYEAQRHWMELTIHLPLREWYTYDLQYWGLDYPPLTAYISWICGVVYVPCLMRVAMSRVTDTICSGSWIDPSWFALGSSRGIESAGSTTYMRTTVLVFDTLVYLPALLLFVRSWHTDRSTRTQVYIIFCVVWHILKLDVLQELALLMLLLQPTLLLIDFGHFQYNSVMLGAHNSHSFLPSV